MLVKPTYIQLKVILSGASVAVGSLCDKNLKKTECAVPQYSISASSSPSTNAQADVHIFNAFVPSADFSLNIAFVSLVNPHHSILSQRNISCRCHHLKRNIMWKPVLHVILYLRAYLPLLGALVNICLKPDEGKAHTPPYPGYLAPI